MVRTNKRAPANKLIRTTPCVKKNAGGRPKSTKILYRREYNRIAESLCKQAGGSTAQLSEVFGIHQVTLKEWRDEHPSFNRAVMKGRDAWDNNEIEKCMAQRAKGFVYREKEFRSELILGPDGAPEKDDDGFATGERELRLVKVTEKQSTPDVSAQKFWLERRNPERWKQKDELAEQQASDNINELLLHKLADQLPD